LRVEDGGLTSRQDDWRRHDGRPSPGGEALRSKAPQGPIPSPQLISLGRHRDRLSHQTKYPSSKTRHSTDAMRLTLPIRPYIRLVRQLVCSIGVTDPALPRLTQGRRSISIEMVYGSLMVPLPWNQTSSSKPDCMNRARRRLVTHCRYCVVLAALCAGSRRCACLHELERAGSLTDSLATSTLAISCGSRRSCH
jgi:hypothetical protein